MANLNELPAVDRFMRNNGLLAPWELTLLQNQHNVNIHSDGTGDEYLDEYPDELEGLTVMDELEFFETYMLEG